MPSYIEYHPDLEERVQLSFSEGEEICLALSCFPDDFDPCQRAWVEDMRRKLPGDLCRRLEVFGQQSDRWFTPTHLLDQGTFRPLELEIARVRAFGADEVRRLVRPELCVDDPLESVLVALAAIDSDPAGWRDQVCNFLEEFHPYFAETWNKLQPRLTKELVRVEQLRAAGVKLPELLPTLSRRVAWDPVRNRFVCATGTGATYTSSDVQVLRLTPTFFGLPHLPLGFNTLGELALGYGVPDALGDSDQDDQLADLGDLAICLESLASLSRLRILRELTGDSYSVRELSERLKLDRPAVDRAIHVLEEAGLVKAIGSGAGGAFKRYEICRGVVGEVGKVLGEFEAN